MIEQIGKSSYYAFVSGLRLSSSVNPAELLTGLRRISKHDEAQALDAGRLVDCEHLMVAANHAVTAFEQQYNIAKTLAMECLLYASAQSQIELAIEKLGVKSETLDVGLVMLSQDPESFKAGIESISRSGMGVVDQSIVDGWSEAKRAKILTTFGLVARQIRAARRQRESERDAIKKLVFEKMALLSLEAQRS